MMTYLKSNHSTLPCSISKDQDQDQNQNRNKKNIHIHIQQSVSEIEVKIENQPLQNSMDDYIVHQCNCVTNRAEGLAKALFTLYPNANTYANRQKGDDKPGTIKIFPRSLIPSIITMNKEHVLSLSS
jgi:hypothetical protein